LTTFSDVVFHAGGLMASSAIPMVNGNYWFVDTNSSSAISTGKHKNKPFRFIQDAVDKAAAGDCIIVAPGQYDESVISGVNNLTIFGLGGRGAVFIEPETVGAEGMQVTSDDVTLINIGVAGESTADYALNLKGASRFRSYGCKLEGPDGIIVLVDGTATGQTADALFQDTEFAWGGKAMIFDDSSYGYPTQIYVKECRFHNIVTNMFGVNSGGLVKDLHVSGSIFGNQEDGTAPTDYILLSDNGNTGFIVGNVFATATNDAAVLTIGTGIKWGPNGTEAGFSTARPA
jgi:hypothetical protein